MDESKSNCLSITYPGGKFDFPKESTFVIVKMKDGHLEFTSKIGGERGPSWAVYPNHPETSSDAEVYAKELKRLGYGVEVRLQS